MQLRCAYCHSSDGVTLLTIVGKKQTIIDSIEARYVLESISTKPILIVMVKEKRAEPPRRLLTETKTERPQ